MREKMLIEHGPDEVDLVYSGLEQTMIEATREIMSCWKAMIKFRTCALQLMWWLLIKWERVMLSLAFFLNNFNLVFKSRCKK